MNTTMISRPPRGIAARFIGAALLLSALPASADSQRFGDWLVERHHGVVVATTSTSDAAIGYACTRSPNQCQFFFAAANLRCAPGSRYSLLFNGGRESTPRNATCRSLEWRSSQPLANVLDTNDTLFRQMLNADGSTVSIARGTGGGDFITSKFSMNGYRGAFDLVNQLHGAGRYSDSAPPRPPQPAYAPPPAPAYYNVDQATGAPKPPFIEVWEHRDFKGRRLFGRANVPHLGQYQFDKLISSIVIHQGQWQFCTSQNFSGKCTVYPPGRYPFITVDNDTFSSYRRVQ
jgi:hypothetical protein